jgi:DNA mismatch repair protein MSH6
MQPRRQQQQSILFFLHKQPTRREPEPAGDGATPEKPSRPPAGSIAGIMERLVRPPQPSGRYGRNDHWTSVCAAVVVEG